MVKEKQLVVTIVNKHYPPGPGITGESANELAGWLEQKGVKVNVVHADGKYAGGAIVAQHYGTSFPMRSLYDGKSKLIRLFSSFVESFRLIRCARKIGSVGLIIVMTDPPFLGFWASVLLKKNKWAYWSMDLYPDAFVAGELVGERNYLYRYYKKIVNRRPPDYIIALGEYQLRHLLKEYAKDIPAAILPCGVSTSATPSAMIPVWKQTDKIIVGYCGNIGEAHSAEFLIKFIQTFDDNKFRMLVSVYGAKAQLVKDALRNRPSVILQDSVPRSELSFIDVHLVTLLPRWNNVCVPSKAVSAVCEGGAIVFCGNTKNDNWGYLQDAAWLVKDDVHLDMNIKDVMDRISPDSLLEKKKAAVEISKKMQSKKIQAFNDIYSFLTGLK